MAVSRRHLVSGFAAAAAAALGASTMRRAVAQAEPPQVVRIVAQRFRYSPAEFHVKAGLPVVLEFTALDFVHGFNLPDFNVRADLVPGTVTRVPLPPGPPGTYEFVCDNFCGDHHEEMHGRMILDA